jgi:hypothetical protein
VSGALQDPNFWVGMAFGALVATVLWTTFLGGRK